MRAKIAELDQSMETLEKDMREQVKGEFIDLVCDLVNVNNGLKCQIDQFKCESFQTNAFSSTILLLYLI